MSLPSKHSLPPRPHPPAPLPRSLVLIPRSLVSRPRPLAPYAIPASRHSRGASVLVFGMIFLVVMAVMQLGQRFLVTQVTDQASRSVYGTMARTLADSALAGLEERLAVRMNDPGDELHRRMRADLPDAARSDPKARLGRASVDPASLPALESFRALEPMKTLQVESLEYDVRFLRPIGARFEQGYEALLELTVTVESKIHRSVTRTVRRLRTLKVVGLGVPPPLNQATVYIRSPFQLVEGTGAPPELPAQTSGLRGLDVPRLLETVITPTYVDRYKDSYEKFLRRFQDDDARESDFIREVEPFYRRVVDDGGVNHLDRMVSLRAQVKAFPDDPARYSLVAVGTPVDLASINYQKRIVQPFDRLQAATARADRLTPIVEREFDDKIPDRALARQHNLELADARLAQVRSIEEILGATVALQQTFRMVDASDAGPEGVLQKELAAAHATVEPAQLIAGFGAAQDRTTIIVDEDPPSANRRPITQKVVEVLTRLDPGQDGLSGAILIRNDKDLLTLSGVLRGRYLLMATGNVVVENLNVAGPGDVITVIAMGGTQGAVKISGDVVASVVVTGRRLIVTPGTRIVGSLVLWDVALDTIESFAGTVIADPRRSGVDTSAFRQVILSPWSRTDEVDRS